MSAMLEPLAHECLDPLVKMAIGGVNGLSVHVSTMIDSFNRSGHRMRHCRRIYQPICNVVWQLADTTTARVSLYPAGVTRERSAIG